MPTIDHTNYSIHLLRHLRRAIGRNIHAVRRRRNVTLEKLARRTGVSAQLLDQYELGNHGIELRELLKIACALGANITKILEG